MQPTSEPELEVAIWRGGAQGGVARGAFRGYRVPRRANQTVLDVVTWV